PRGQARRKTRPLTRPDPPQAVPGTAALPLVPARNPVSERLSLRNAPQQFRLDDADRFSAFFHQRLELSRTGDPPAQAALDQPDGRPVPLEQHAVAQPADARPAVDAACPPD